MSKWLDAQVVEIKQWSERLFSLRLKADFPEFEAGQFTRLALQIDGEEVSRAFSLVNAPDDELLEIYFIEVLEGTLSPRLAALKAGDSVQVANRASGLMTLSQVPDSQQLFLISTGTGIGPFLSMLKTATPWQRFEKVVLVHAVRTHAELTYQELINSFAEAYPQQFSYVPFVSRERSDFALFGRIPQAIEDGRLEERAEAKFDPLTSHVMLCGNPDMVAETMDVLMEQRGLTRHSRKQPGNISIEKYW